MPRGAAVIEVVVCMTRTLDTVLQSGTHHVASLKPFSASSVCLLKLYGQIVCNGMQCSSTLQFLVPTMTYDTLHLLSLQYISVFTCPSPCFVTHSVIPWLQSLSQLLPLFLALDCVQASLCSVRCRQINVLQISSTLTGLSASAASAVNGLVDIMCTV